MGLESDAARAGPPRAYQIDRDVYELTGSWWPLVEHLGAASWQLPLLLDITHPDDAQALRERLHDFGDRLSMADLVPIAGRIVQAATGRPWWIAGRLLLWADQHWAELDGAMSMRGLDIGELIDRAPGRACNVVYAFLVDGADAKERAKFDHVLTQPPAGLDEEAARQAEEWAAEDEGAMFMAAMGQPGRAQGMRIGGAEPNAHLTGQP